MKSIKQHHLSYVGAVRVSGELDQSAGVCQDPGDLVLLLGAGELQQELDHATPDLVQGERQEVGQDHLVQLPQLGGRQHGDQLLDNIAGLGTGHQRHGARVSQQSFKNIPDN